MSLGTETLTPPMCAVRTSPPSSGIALSAVPCFVAVSKVLTSPRLLSESSRRSSWLYWSLVTPSHTQVPSVMTVTTTDSAPTMTMARNDNTLITGRSTGRNNRSTRSSRLTGVILPDALAPTPNAGVKTTSSTFG